MSGTGDADISIVVTGLGVVLAAGLGREALERSLEDGAATRSVVDTTPGYHVPGSPREAALAATLDLSPWVPPARARRLSLPSRYAVAAAVPSAGPSTVDRPGGSAIGIRVCPWWAPTAAAW